MFWYRLSSVTYYLIDRGNELGAADFAIGAVLEDNSFITDVAIFEFIKA